CIPLLFFSFFGYPVGWYWTGTLYVITPLVCSIVGILIFFDGRTAGISTNWTSFLTATGAAFITPTIIAAVIVYRVTEVVRSGQSLRNLFVTDFKWGPKVSTDRQRAIHEEHAARIYT
uniref:Uncharacterized protein n=1 Tax=Parascaris univalens TaxID=6257 RepID=A0A915A3I1_PARUN